MVKSVEWVVSKMGATKRGIVAADGIFFVLVLVLVLENGEWSDGVVE